MNKLIIFTITMLTLTNANAQKLIAPYTIVSSEYKTQGAELVIQNMPKVRSQDSVGLCYAFSSATLLQKYYCDLHQSITDCSGLPDKEIISPVVLTGLAKPLSTASAKAVYFPKSTDSIAGGDSSNLLKNATKTKKFCAESNFPFDKFVGMNRFSNMDRVAAAKAMEKLADDNITNLKNIYDQRKTEAVAIEECTECLNAVSAVMPVNVNNRVQPVDKGLAKKTFQEFLFQSYFGGCDDILGVSDNITYGEYPEVDIVVDVQKYQADPNHPVKVAYMNQIKKVLKNKVPLQTSFCGQKIEGDDKKCVGYHAAVISGYKTVCKPNGQCIEMLKIHNSYGAEWQEKYNDGWVVANDILNSIAGITEIQKIEHSSLSWITDGPLK